MTRESLWDAYVSRNPTFASPGNVTLSAAGLRKLFDQTWDHGEAHGREAALDDLGDLGGGLAGKGADLFNEMFGKFGKGKKP